VNTSLWEKRHPFSFAVTCVIMSVPVMATWTALLVMTQNHWMLALALPVTVMYAFGMIVDWRDRRDDEKWRDRFAYLLSEDMKNL